MKKNVLRLTGVIVLAGALVFLFAQQNNSLPSINPLGELLKEDSAVTAAIAAYPDTIRKSALRVCGYPEGILKMEELQKKTRQSFSNIVAPLTKEEQERIWNISRYKGLTEKIVSANYQYAGEYGNMASDYPEDVQADIGKCGVENRSALVQIVSLNKSTEASFKSIIAKYPATTQAAFRTVLDYPELIELLGGNMRMAVKAGDLEKEYPGKLHHQLDSFNIELARQKTKETEDWKNGIEKDLVAKNEFINATKEYEDEHNITAKNTIVNQTVVVNYVCYPYSYWYGYPWWYAQPYWYPYPYWYACGYYYSPSGIIYIGYPTPYYTSWYFYHYHHHYHYCHFSDYYIGHYYGHRRSPSSSDRVVEKWIRDEQPRVSPAFFSDNPARPDHLKELGRAEMDRADYNSKNPDKPMTRDAYVKSNPESYPNLVVPAEHPKNATNQPAKDPVMNKPVPPVQQKPDAPQQPRPNYPQPKQTPPPVVQPKPKGPPSQAPRPVPKPQPPVQQPPKTRPR